MIFISFLPFIFYRDIRSRRFVRKPRARSLDLVCRIRSHVNDRLALHWTALKILAGRAAYGLPIGEGVDEARAATQSPTRRATAVRSPGTVRARGEACTGTQRASLTLPSRLPGA